MVSGLLQRGLAVVRTWQLDERCHKGPRPCDERMILLFMGLPTTVHCGAPRKQRAGYAPTKNLLDNLTCAQYKSHLLFVPVKSVFGHVNLSTP